MKEPSTIPQLITGLIFIVIGFILFLTYIAHPYAKYIQSLDGFY